MMVLFFSTLALVFLLGMQQQNVTHGHHGWSFITSLPIAMANVAFVKLAGVASFWEAVLPMWIGGALGASLSMVVHRRFIRRARGAGVIGEVV